MKKVFILFVIFGELLTYSTCLLGQTLQQIGDGEHIMKISEMKSIGLGVQRFKDTVYNSDVVSKSGISSSLSEVKILESALVIGFVQQSLADPLAQLDHESSVSMLIKYKKWNRLTTVDSVRIQLSLNYNREQGKNYKAKDFYTIDSVAWAEVKIDTFRTNASWMDGSEQIKLSIQILGSESRTPRTGTAISDSFSLKVKKEFSYIKISFQEQAWASSYDLEWKFIDGYSSEPIQMDKNSTRININKNEYQIPMISSKAKFVARVRGRSIRPDKTTYIGRWSNISSPMSIEAEHIFEQDSKPWQYKTSYLENGIRADQVSFFDGTGKLRQTLTKSNVKGQHIIASESYYDYHGRPVIQALPTPVKPTEKLNVVGGTTGRSLPRTGTRIPTGGQIDRRFIPSGVDLSTGSSRSGSSAGSLFTEINTYLEDVPPLRFIPKLNTNESGEQYSAKDFDRDIPNCSDEILARKMSNNSGTAKYYSSNNDIADLHRDEIPEANGFPFMQVEYTPDNTGRIKRSGLAGEAFQIGSGKDTKYYYAIPSQTELTRLFGREVGDASHYTKQIVKNPDGQIYISYLNSKGQTIASALAGNKPENLEALPDQEIPIDVSYSITSEDHSFNYRQGTSHATKILFIETEGSDLKLRYQINPADVNLAVCAQNVCYDCPKTIVLRIKNSCGQSLMTKRIRIGPFNDGNISNCESSRNIPFDTTLTSLAVGEYHFSKHVEIDEEARKKYIEDFIQRDTACYNPPFTPALPCVNPTACIPCNFEVVDGLPIRLPSSNPLCSKNCLEANYNFDMLHFSMMAGDMRPGGKYGSMDLSSVDSFGVSMFNYLLVFDGFVYRKIPAFGYKDLDGATSWIDITDAAETDYILSSPPEQYKIENGRKYTIPQNIQSFELLKNVWKETWSELLVQFHPEFPLLQWNNKIVSSLHHDESMSKTSKFDAAVEKNYLRVDAGISVDWINSDPFFETASNPVKEDMINRLRQSSPMRDGSYLTIYESVVAQMFCNAPAYANASTMRSCVGENLGRLNSLSEEAKNFAWTTFRAIYQDAKQRIVDSLRNYAINTEFGTVPEGPRKNHLRLAICTGINVQGDCHNCSIATANPSLRYRYRKMQSCFSHSRCIRLDNIPLEGRTVDLNTAKAYADAKLMSSCGKSPQSVVFLAFLNSLVMDKWSSSNKFTGTDISLNDIPPVVIPEMMYSTFPNPSARNYRWSATISGNETFGTSAENKLKATIRDDRGVIQTEMEFKADSKFKWNKIKYFGCIDEHKKNKNIFHLKVFDYSNKVYTIELKLNDVLALKISYNPSYLSTLIGILKKSNLDKNLNEKNALCCLDHLFPEVEIKNKCEQSQQENRQDNLIAAKQARALMLKDSLKVIYTSRCLNGGEESCSLSTKQKSYYFTLFYYDLAGNLTKTIPPLAVRVATGAGTPNHDENLVTRFTYNSQNAKTSKTTPDGGTTKFVYDEVGRIILSQDPVLRASAEANYIKYDSRGRTVEGGTVQAFNNINTIMDAGRTTYSSYRRELDAVTTFKKDYTVTIYDVSTSDRNVLDKFKMKSQSNLRNRVAAVKSFSTGTNLQHAFYFDYDIAGNAREIIQDFANLQSIPGISADIVNNHRIKSIRYKYDVLSGKMNEVAYQEGYSDQFYRWYSYDADLRITSVKTGFSRWEPEIYKDIDARYEYYMHGPVARAVLGSENIQSLDLNYTINGWFKSLNSSSMDNGSSLPDQLSYSLNYFNQDYRGIGHPIASSLSGPSLYSGNISQINIWNKGLDNAERTHQYKYDQMNRLVQSMPNGRNEYRMDLSYDKNGNIQTLDRYDGRGNRFDQLRYQYDPSRKNRLNHILDNSRTRLSGNITDLATQSENNYQYDAKGRLTSDVSEGNIIYHWNNKDRLEQVESNLENLHFKYDALGSRVIKINSNDSEHKYKLLVNDINGNNAATYTLLIDSVVLNSFPIYSGSRIGLMQSNKKLLNNSKLNKWEQLRGSKVYELKNQISDANIQVSDRKCIDGINYNNDIRSATEYYPFGMTMPGRDSSGLTLDYGYQGMAKDNEIKGKGNAYSTEYRQYDPRLGNWNTADPKEFLFENITPYNFVFNNPIVGTDPKGDCPPCWGAAIGLAGGLAAEGVSWAITGNAPDPAGAFLRVAISTGAGALTGGLSTIETFSGSVTVTVGQRVALGIAIEVGSNALQQEVSVNTGEQDEYSGTQLVLSAAFSGAGSAIESRLATRSLARAEARAAEYASTVVQPPSRFIRPSGHIRNTGLRIQARDAQRFADDVSRLVYQPMESSWDETAGAVYDIAANAAQAAMTADPRSSSTAPESPPARSTAPSAPREDSYIFLGLEGSGGRILSREQYRAYQSARHGSSGGGATFFNSDGSVTRQ
ncbi:MAG: RHS repeat protein [Saprospiraceae bacterium]|nr:RHS repeat protein [Saprospiraceae bacterium]